MNNLIIGKEGEQRASDYLNEKGYKIISRNYKCVYGEIDIIVFDESCLRIVEVKTRRSTRYGLPCEAVSEQKRLHLKKCAEHFIQAYNLWNCDVSFDVIEILIRGDSCSIRHHKSCF